MDLVTVIFCVWVLLLAWRGSKRGLWPSLANSLAVLCGYLCCFFILPHVLELTGEKMGQGWTWMFIAVGIFIFASLVCMVAIRMLGKLMPASPMLDKLGGTLVGGVYGVAVGLLMVWGLGLLFGSLQHRPKMPSFDAYFTSTVVRFAGTVVGGTLNQSLQWYGVSENKAKIAGALAQQPGYVVTSLQEVTQSQVTKSFLSNAEMQQKMLQNDVEGLSKSPEFQAFVAQPAVQEFVEVMEPVGLANTDQEIAQTVSKVWQATHALQEDPKFQALVNDPELKQALESQDTAALLRSSKASELVALVIEQLGQEGVEAQAADLAPFVETLTEGVAKSAAVEKTLYQWYDESGKVHYSHIDSIPKQFRDKARALAK